MRAFEDLTVLDFTQSVAGPLSTQFLDLMGADVVKVEPPDGDTFREYFDGNMFVGINPGDKRSLCLDLKTDDGREIARELATKADVVVESFRPGVVDKFDLDYESVSADNEDVIYCSLTGYGQDGPRSNWPAYDPMIQAISGLMKSVTPRDRPPIRVGASMIDYGTGLIAALLMTSAVLQRHRTGEGEYVDVSLFDTGIWYMGYWIARYTVAGEYQQSADDELSRAAPIGGYFAADEEPFYLAVVNDAFYERLCLALDREDLLADERFQTNEGRYTNREELEGAFDEEFREWDRDELVRTLVEAGVTAAPVQTVAEVVEDDPQVDAREMLTDAYNLHEDQEVRIVRPPFKTSEGRPDPGYSPPTCGEHTREILAELGYDEGFIDDALDRGAVRESME